MVPMRVINSTPRSVMIEGVDGGGSSLGQAQSLAEQECQKHSRHSVFNPTIKGMVLHIMNVRNNI